MILHAKLQPIQAYIESPFSEHFFHRHVDQKNGKSKSFVNKRGSFFAFHGFPFVNDREIYHPSSLGRKEMF